MSSQHGVHAVMASLTSRSPAPEMLFSEHGIGFSILDISRNDTHIAILSVTAKFLYGGHDLQCFMTWRSSEGKDWQLLYNVFIFLHKNGKNSNYNQNIG